MTTQIDEERTNVVQIAEREFEIGAPDTPLLLRALKVIAEIEARQPDALVGLVNALNQAINGEDSEGEQAARKVLLFLAALEEDDLYRLGTALLQIRDERQGTAWLRDNGLPLSVLLQALFINWQQAQPVIADLTAVIQNFTPTLAATLGAETAGANADA